MKPKSVKILSNLLKPVPVVIAALLVAYFLYPHPRHVSKESGKTEIVFWAHGSYLDLYRVAIEEFERLHPEYEVIMGTSAVRDVTGDPTRFLLGVAGGLPPDVIVFDRFAVVEWASRGAFHDLSPYLQQNLNEKEPIRAENYFKAAWAETELDEKVYAIPSTFDTRAMYYHKDPLIRAGYIF
jgi:multiple sugar transport system substrate-binding protein